MSVTFKPRFMRLAKNAILAAMVLGAVGREPVLIWLHAPDADANREVPEAVNSGLHLLGLIAVTRDWRVHMEAANGVDEALMLQARSEFLAALAVLQVKAGVA